jgi:hypothetical protein
VKSKTTARFRDGFASLPEQVKRQAREAYRLFQIDPHHPGLRFKKVHQRPDVYSVRINIEYRALGVPDADTIIWFWIGSHADYDRILKQL